MTPAYTAPPLPGVSPGSPNAKTKSPFFCRRGSTEAYLGDFTADFSDTEFARCSKVLSGGKLKGILCIIGDSTPFILP